MTAESAPPVLRLDGEIDMLVAEAVGARGSELLATTGPGEPLVVDLDGVTFLDSAGLNMLVRLRLEALERGRWVELHNIPDRVTRLLEITGLAEVFATS